MHGTGLETERTEDRMLMARLRATPSAQNQGHNNCSAWSGRCRLRAAVIVKMMQVASLQETIAKGRRHYYDGVTFRNWKLTMVKMYGGGSRPFLDDAWNAIIGEAESRAQSSRETANKKRFLAGTHAPAALALETPSL